MAIHLFEPFFRLDECLNEISDCLDKGWTGLGFKTVAFEEAWKAYSGHKFAHFLNSNTSGLFLTFELLRDSHGWTEHSEIITTPLTFVSTNQAILNAGLRPVFADVDQSLNLDPRSVERCITSSTKAVIFVGIGGNIDNYLLIKKICHDNNLIFILDAAHMAGAKLYGSQVGIDADVSIFSFQAVKNLPTADSGMICFKVEEFDSIARKRSWVGINKDTYTRTLSDKEYKWYYDVEFISNKYHGNSIMASMALVGLKYLDQDNEYRRMLAARYISNLHNHNCVEIVHHCTQFIQDSTTSQHLFQILVDSKIRDDLMHHLNTKGIYPGVHYRSNLNYRIFSKYLDPTKSYLCDQLSKQIISLPLHLRLKQDDIDFVSNAILEYFLL